LEQKPVKGNEVLGDECVPGQDVFIQCEPKQGADFIIAVIGKPPAVGYQDEKEIEQQFMLGGFLPESVAEKAVLDKGKTALNAPDPIRNKHFFFNHVVLLEAVSLKTPIDSMKPRSMPAAISPVRKTTDDVSASPAEVTARRMTHVSRNPGRRNIRQGSTGR
jgi:hypothetical protein